MSITSNKRINNNMEGLVDWSRVNWEEEMRELSKEEKKEKIKIITEDGKKLLEIQVVIKKLGKRREEEYRREERRRKNKKKQKRKEEEEDQRRIDKEWRRV